MHYHDVSSGFAEREKLSKVAAKDKTLRRTKTIPKSVPTFFLSLMQASLEIVVHAEGDG